MSTRPARPAVKLQYLLWDGTDPKDSHALGNGLEKSFRCVNLLNDCPAGEFGISAPAPKKPRVFEPCGATGADTSDSLYLDGMFTFPPEFVSPVHHNAGGDLPHILAYSGHGIPGYMFSESTILICASRPPGTASTSWNAGRSHVDFLGIVPWNNPNTKVVLFSACRQLAGRPQQFFWSQWMRGANRVHTILSYRETAPAASTSAEINRSFVANLKRGQTLVKAWSNAHGGSLKKRWAALSYRSAVGDRMDKWAREGSLSSSPAEGEDILYFDEAHQSGRVVTEPDQVLDCFLTFRSSIRATVTALSAGMRLVPWYPLRKDMRLNLHVKWTNPKSSFQNDDIVWIALLQVRPDYSGPFDIEQIIKVEAPAHGNLSPLGRIHNAKKGWEPDTYTDLYELTIDRSSTWLGHDASWNEITIPVTVGNAINDHVPVYYFMVRVQRGDTNFGIPITIHHPTSLEIADQALLPDDFQYQAFVLFDAS